MQKSKGRFRKFLRGLRGGNPAPDQQRSSQLARIATPSSGAANDGSSINKGILGDKKDEAKAKNAVWTEVRASTEAEGCESPSPSYEAEAIDERDVSREIWIEAYTSLQNGEGTKDLVNVYEMVLSQQLKGGVEQSVVQTTNVFSRCGSDVGQKIPQMRLVTENTLSDASKHSGVADGFTKAADLISELNGIVSPMIQSNPVAALAWGGICAALPLLLRPITADSDMAGGLLYVIGRMQWYMGLVRGLLDATDAGKTNEELRAQFKHRILDLYTNILTYQMQSVCYCYHDRTIMKALRAVVALDDWEGRLESIQKLEAAVEKDMSSFAAVETLSSLAEIARSSKKLDIISSSLAQFVASQDQARKEEEERRLEAERTVRSELVGQFKTTDYERQMKLNPIRVPGTCEWFCKHKKFNNWLSGRESGLFLASADPGCGKSTLARHLVEEVLPRDADTTDSSYFWTELHQLIAQKVLYFFFKDSPEQRLLTNALCAILHQLFYRKTQIAGQLKHEILKSMPQALSDFSTLWAVFAAACKDKNLGKVICVFDALDECEQEGMRILAESLDQLLQNLGPNDSKTETSIKFLITTRGYPEILEQFSDVVSDIVYLSGDEKDEKDQIQAEIGLVLDYQLERLAKKKHFKAERKERIYEALKAQGSEQRTYLWLKLIFELLESTFKTTTRDWEKLIAKPPSTVNKAYETLLARVDDNEKEAVRVLLHIIIAARQPLTLCEMNVALNVRIQPEVSDEESLGLSTDEEFKLWLLHTCGFFVTVYDERVFFIHQTAKEFLLRPDLESGGSDGVWCRSITNRDAERMISESCIAYLSLKQFHRRAFRDRVSQIQKAQLEYESFPEEALAYSDPDPGPFNAAFQSLFTDFKFSYYALGFWARHFRKCQYLHEAEVFDVSDAFFDKYLALFATDSPGPPAWLLATLYRDTYLDWHDDGRQRYRDDMIQGYSVAKAAAYYNHIRLFQHAVQQSALSPTETGREEELSKSGTTLLHLAMFKDCSTDFLGTLASHVNVDARDGIAAQTALSLAGSMGHWRAMDVLLDHGADPRIADCYGYSPLTHVARHYLIAFPAKGGEYFTIMDRLFSQGADANSTSVPADLFSTSSSDKSSLLTMAATSLAGLHGLRAEMKAVVASRSGDIVPHVSSTTQAMLCPGFDLFSEPAFLDAFDESFVKFLLDHGASIDLPNETGEFKQMTPLQSAYHYSYASGNDEVFPGIAFLLHAGASPLPLGPERYKNSETSESEPDDDFDMFKDKPASWMLLVKSLGYNPTSPPEDSTLSFQASGTLLHEAVRWHWSLADWVWLMLKRGENINGRDEEGQTALHIASSQGLAPVVELLLQQGADVDARNKNGQTPLHMARNEEVVRCLCAAGADTNARDNYELTPLHGFYHHIGVTAAVALLEYGVDVSVRDSRGKTPLHLACQDKDSTQWYASQVDVLLHHRVDIDARDTEGITPIHEACDHTSPELVKVLLAHHADIEAQDTKGQTPLLRTCETMPVDPLHLRDEEARLETVKLLLEHHADIEAQDQQGLTPLHKACQGTEYQLVKVLLEHSAKIKAKDASGCTPLHVACRDGCDGPVEALLEHGADVDDMDPSGNTPVHIACRRGNYFILRALLEHRPDLDLKATDFSGKTPLDLVHEEFERSSVEDSVSGRRFAYERMIELLEQHGSQSQDPTEQLLPETEAHSLSRA